MQKEPGITVAQSIAQQTADGSSGSCCKMWPQVIEMIAKTRAGMAQHLAEFTAGETEGLEPHIFIWRLDARKAIRTGVAARI